MTLRDDVIAELELHASHDYPDCQCGVPWSIEHLADRMLGVVSEATARAVTANRVGPVGGHDPETSHGAARRNAVRSGSQRAIVLQAFAVAGQGGRTDFENEHLLGMKRPSPGNRRHELAEDGLVVKTGLRRKTDTGALAIVWRITDLGLETVRRLDPPPNDRDHGRRGD